MVKFVCVEATVTQAGGTVEWTVNLPTDAARIIAIHADTDIGAIRFPPDAPPYTLPDAPVELNAPTNVVERFFTACMDSSQEAYRKWDSLVCKVCYRYENGQLVEMWKSWENLTQETGIEQPSPKDILPVEADSSPYEEVVSSLSFSLSNELATFPYVPLERMEEIPQHYRRVMMTIEAGGENINRYVARFGQRTQVSEQIGLGVLSDAPLVLSKGEFLSGGLQGIQAAPPHTVQLIFLN